MSCTVGLYHGENLLSNGVYHIIVIIIIASSLGVDADLFEASPLLVEGNRCTMETVVEVFKWHEDDSIILAFVGEVSLLDISLSPELALVAPRSEVSLAGPWVSQFHELRNDLTVDISWLEGAQDCVSMTWNETSFSSVTTSSHWVVLTGKLLKYLPEIVLVRILFLGEVHCWHGSESSQSFLATSTGDPLVVLVELSEGLLEEWTPPGVVSGDSGRPGGVASSPFASWKSVIDVDWDPS